MKSEVNIVETMKYKPVGVTVEFPNGMAVTKKETKLIATKNGKEAHFDHDGEQVMWVQHGEQEMYEPCCTQKKNILEIFGVPFLLVAGMAVGIILLVVYK